MAPLRLRTAPVPVQLTTATVDWLSVPDRPRWSSFWFATSVISTLGGCSVCYGILEPTACPDALDVEKSPDETTCPMSRRKVRVATFGKWRDLQPKNKGVERLRVTGWAGIQTRV